MAEATDRPTDLPTGIQRTQLMTVTNILLRELLATGVLLSLIHI